MKVVLLIYYHEKASNLTTSEPSPREVVCRVADGEAKLYKKKVQDTRDKNVPLVAGRETEISDRHDGKRGDARDGNFHSLQCSRQERPLFVMITGKTHETETRSSQRVRRETPACRNNEKSRHEMRTPRFVIKY